MATLVFINRLQRAEGKRDALSARSQERAAHSRGPQTAL
jgi:hypothetical protein